MTDLEIYNLVLETISNKPDLLEMLNVKIIEDDLHVNVRQTLDEVFVATFHMSTKNCSMVGMLINNMLYPSETITMEFLKESENEIVREVANPALLDLILNQYESLSHYIRSSEYNKHETDEAYSRFIRIALSILIKYEYE